MKTIKKSFWLDFDLSNQQITKALFTWLDLKAAEQCASETAYFKLDVPEHYTRDEISEWVKKDILKLVPATDLDTLYLIFQDEKGRLVGRYLSGGRRRAPWVGFAPFDPKSEAIDE